MRKIFRFSSYSVRCDFVGIVSGGFSEKYNSDVAIQNMKQLVASHKSEHASRIIPGMDYEARFASPFEDVIKAGSLITDVSGHTLTLRPADCIPLIVFSRKRPLLALIHCGRRELDADIVRKTIRIMRVKWHVQTNELEAYLGPGIKKDSYLLPIKVKSNLQHVNWGDYTTTLGDRIALDLFGFASFELVKAGIKETAIDSSSIDTATDPAYYSHYATRNFGKQPGLNGFAVTITL